MDSIKRSERIQSKMIKRLTRSFRGVKRSELIEFASHNDYPRGRWELDRLSLQGRVYRGWDRRYHLSTARFWNVPEPTPEPVSAESFWA